MNRLIIPLSILLAIVVAVARNELRKTNDLDLQAIAIADTAQNMKAAQEEAARLQNQTSHDYEDLARAKSFVEDWASAHSRSIRGGVEARVAEIGSTEEVSPSQVRLDKRMEFSEIDNVKFDASNFHFEADGKLSNILRFFAEAERSFPAELVQSVRVSTNEREPRIYVDFSVLQRAFTDIPPLPKGLPSPANTGLFARRPETKRTLFPEFSDNLVAKGNSKSPALSVAAIAELKTILPGFTITGVVWSPKDSDRVVMANKRIYRQGDIVPSTFASGKGRVIVTEIGQQKITFTIETEEYNPATGKLETSKQRKDWPFTIFDQLSDEG